MVTLTFEILYEFGGINVAQKNIVCAIFLNHCGINSAQNLGVLMLGQPNKLFKEPRKII